MGLTAGSMLSRRASTVSQTTGFERKRHRGAERFAKLQTLESDQFEPWLTGAAGTELLTPAADDALQRWPVSKGSIARADVEDATLIDAVAIEPDRAAQSDLFAP